MKSGQSSPTLPPQGSSANFSPQRGTTPPSHVTHASQPSPPQPAKTPIHHRNQPSPNYTNNMHQGLKQNSTNARFRSLVHTNAHASDSCITCGAPMKQDEYELDISKIESGEVVLTALMVKNVANRYTQELLLEAINVNHAGLYDFFYLPIDFKVCGIVVLFCFFLAFFAFFFLVYFLFVFFLFSVVYFSVVYFLFFFFAC
jgi:hypothetical protein